MISVVIPLYNKEHYIKRAIDSVLRQTCTDFELLVIDDGSTDGSAEVVLLEKDPRIRLIVQKNGGVSAARNRGIEEARSELIAFLDADDEWMPEFLELVYLEYQKDPSVGVVFTNYRLSSSNKPFLASHSGGRLIDYFDFCLINNGRGIWSSCVLVKRDALRKIGGFPLNMHHGEDIYTWTRLAWEVPVAFVPQVKAIYHLGVINQATSLSPHFSVEGPARIASMCSTQLEQGRVPLKLFCSTRAYAVLMYLLSANAMKDAGDSLGAILTILKKCNPFFDKRNMRVYCRVLLRCIIPTRILQMYRQIKQI